MRRVLRRHRLRGLLGLQGSLLGEVQLALLQRQAPGVTKEGFDTGDVCLHGHVCEVERDVVVFSCLCFAALGWATFRQ